MSRYGFVVGWLIVLAAFLFGVGLWFGPSTPERLLSCVISATGFLVGVAGGIFLSPFNRKEKEAFEAYGKTISALITGWLLAKVDDLAKAVFKPEALVQNNGLGALRLLLFLAGVIGAAVIVFYHRRYIADRSGLEDAPAPTPSSATGVTETTGTGLSGLTGTTGTSTTGTTTGTTSSVGLADTTKQPAPRVDTKQ